MEKEEIALQILLKIMDKQEGKENSCVHHKIEGDGIYYVFDPEEIAKTFNLLCTKIKFPQKPEDRP